MPSEPVVLATAGAVPQGLTVANGSLYWMEASEDVLRTVSVAGGPIGRLATLMVHPAGLGFYGADVIWVDSRSSGSSGDCLPGSPGDRVLKRTTPAGQTSTLHSGSAGDGGPDSLVVMGAVAYWITSGACQWSINAVPLDGTPPKRVYVSPGYISTLAGHGGTLYWVEFQNGLNTCAIRGIVPGSTGSITTIVSTFQCGMPGGHTLFAVDEAAVYYYDLAANALLAQPLTGGPPTILSASSGPPLGVVAAGPYVAWIDLITDSVKAVPRTGGAETVLATIPLGAESPDMLFDGANVLWIEVAPTSPSYTQTIQSVPLLPNIGTARTLYTGMPLRLALDSAGRLNWSEGAAQAPGNNSDVRIARMTTSGSIETVVAGLSSWLVPFVVTPTAVLAADHAIESIPAAGGIPHPFAKVGAMSLATDGTWLYWYDGSLSKAPLSGGGGVTVLVPAGVQGVAGAGLMRIAPNDNVYWQTSFDNNGGPITQSTIVAASAITPSNSVIQIGSLFDITDFQSDGSRVYVAQSVIHFGTGDILSFPANGGGLVQQLSNTPTVQLALDNSVLYWLDATGIKKTATTGGAETVVVDNSTISSFALDADNVYFVEGLEIKKIPK